MPSELRRAPRVILPGVGAAADAMERLQQLGLARVIPTLTQPVLGICLGMQLLFEASEEGDTACLGILPGRVTRVSRSPGLSGAAHGLEPDRCRARITAARGPR